MPIPTQYSPGRSIASRHRPSTSAASIAYRVKIHLDETEDAVLRDGMTASVVIHTGTVESILLVPSWAVRSDQSGPVPQLYCYVLRADGTPERRTITLGRYNGDFTEVLSGLEEGDTVALITEERSLFDFGPPGYELSTGYKENVNEESYHVDYRTGDHRRRRRGFLVVSQPPDCKPKTPHKKSSVPRKSIKAI